MAKSKGKEPAGLRRWRLARKKKNPAMIGYKARRKSMARRKNTTRRRNRVKIPVAVVLGFLPLVSTAITDFQAGGINGLKNTATTIIPYSPVNRRFTTARLHLGLYPIIAGFLVHKVIGGMLGVNRAIASAGVPFIRL